MGAYDYFGEGTSSMYTDWGDELVGDSGMGLGDGTDFGPAAGGTMYTDQPTIFAVQAALLRHGFNPGVQDGKFGPNTEAALAQFNARRGVARRGPPDLDTLHALGLQPGGYAWGVSAQDAVGIAIAGSTGISIPSTVYTPPRIPGTIPISVPAQPRPSPQNVAVGPLTPAGGGGGGKTGKGAGGVLGFLKAHGTMLAVGAAAVVAGSSLLSRGGGRPAPVRRRRRR